MASPLNLDTLQPAYTLISDEHIEGRRIIKYLLSEEGDVGFSQGAQAVQRLLAGNPSLVPIFEVARQSLIPAIRENRYIIINDRAICLIPRREAPHDAPIGYIDHFFTELVMREPVSCSEGHYFDKPAISFWTRAIGDACPVCDRTVGRLEVDQRLQRATGRYLAGVERRESTGAAMADRVASAERGAMLGRAETAMLSTRVDHLLTKRDLLIGLGTAAKGVTKVTFIFEKSATVASSRTLKHIPVFGFITGLCLAAYRLHKGEYKRAGAELMSGSLSTLPGVGIAASLVIDVALLACDVREIKASNSLEVASEVQVSVAAACKWLGIDPNAILTVTQAEVTRAYRTQIQLLHPDTAISRGESETQKAQVATQLINKAKEVIFLYRGWA